ncbi:uncharacterized protein [Pempheris klunzingeri]|uniref:uncharacterized protein n=1 Tax=Pempheris klunzingeri TaxID=3127111 RepID=UPI0039800518
MENSDGWSVHSLEVNTGISSDPQQKQGVDYEPDTQTKTIQGTPEPGKGPPPRTPIEFRIQQLHNRRFLLLKMQHLRKKAEDNSGTEEMTGEDSDQVCELEAIQKELEELLLKKEELDKQGKSSTLSQANVWPAFYKTETPHGGIYMLPPPEGSTLRPEGPTGPIVPVDSLDHTPAVIQCPSCKEVVFTQTHSKVGEAVWMVCCLCSMLGCVAGCCLIPFFMSQLREVHHQCPQCQAHIHTQQPF